MDSVVCFVNTYPLEGDLSFEQPAEPGLLGGDLRAGGGGGTLYKIIYGEALPRGPVPFPFVHHFDRISIPLSGGSRGGARGASPHSYFG